MIIFEALNLQQEVDHTVLDIKIAFYKYTEDYEQTLNWSFV